MNDLTDSSGCSVWGDLTYDIKNVWMCKTLHDT